MVDGNLTWHEHLRLARGRLGVSRRELADKAGFPADTLRRWEDGTRHPSEARLRALLAALNCPSGEVNAILSAAGYLTYHTLFPEDRYPNYFYSVEQLQPVVEEVPWPEFVLNDRAEFVAANFAAQALWRIDYAWEKAQRTAAQMNALSVANDHRFAELLVNWEEVVAVLIAGFKANPRPYSPDDSDPYFNAVLAEFASGDPAFLKRLIETWEKTEARDPKVRWTFPVVWRDEDFGIIRFIDIVDTASELEGLSFNDWIPQDAESWQVLERVKARGVPKIPANSPKRSGA